MSDRFEYAIYLHDRCRDWGHLFSPPKKDHKEDLIKYCDELTERLNDFHIAHNDFEMWKHVNEKA